VADRMCQVVAVDSGEDVMVRMGTDMEDGGRRGRSQSYRVFQGSGHAINMTSTHSLKLRFGNAFKITVRVRAPETFFPIQSSRKTPPVGFTLLMGGGRTDE
jgi:hypothetical protein